MTADPSQRLRPDAADNRERILRAAVAAFSERGLDVPMREIARRAGVAPATLYRRFPTKRALAGEAFAVQMRACRAVVDDSVADPDPWRGFRTLVERICELHVANRRFTAAFMAASPPRPDVAESQRAALRAVARLARRAQDAGGLREDFVLDDLVLMLRAHRGVRAGSPEVQAAASRRFAALTIAAFQAPGPAAGGAQGRGGLEPRALRPS